MNVQLITLDPGHFHAALVQKEMYGGVDPRAHVFAPLAPDLLAHLQRIFGFNSRASNPTDWRLEVHAGSDFFDRFLAEKPGNVVVLSGRNGKKIDYLEAAVGVGLNVLADKPWIIRAEDLPRLQNVLDTADSKGLIALDIMTERYEITSILQRILVNDADIFGAPEPGTAEDPGVYMESVHYLMKQVAGVQGLPAHLDQPLLETAGWETGFWLSDYVYSFGWAIGGGTSEIMRNVIGERMLGLPR